MYEHEKSHYRFMNDSIRMFQFYNIIRRAITGSELMKYNFTSFSGDDHDNHDITESTKCTLILTHILIKIFCSFLLSIDQFDLSIQSAA